MIKKAAFLVLMMSFMTALVFAGGSKEESSMQTEGGMPFKGQTLIVSMWGYNMDAIEKNVFQPFTDKHGVEIVTETGNNSDRFTKMAARKDNPQVDVALFAGSWAYKAMEEGLIKPYQPSLISNLDSLMDSAKDPLGGRYAIGYTIQHLGLFYRTDKVREITSWKDLSRDELAGFLTVPQITTTYGPSLIYMLSKAWSGDFQNTEAGWEKLKELAPSVVTAYSRSSELNTLVLQEEVYAAPYASFAWGSIKGSGLEVKSVIPQEGLVGSYSMVSVGAGTQKEELAHLYLDHLLSYEVQLAEAMALIDSPVHKQVKLPPDIAENMTYGDDLIGQLHFFDHKEMAANQEEWINRWNTIFSE